MANTLIQVSRFGHGQGLIRTDDHRDNRYLARNNDPEIKAMLAGVPFELLPEYPNVPAYFPDRVHYQTREYIDQGALPYDVGAAWRHYLVSSPLIATLGPSWVEIYKGAQALDEYPSTRDGTTVRAGGEVLRARGYLKNYYWLETVEEVRLALLLGKGPLVAGTDWWTGMDDPRGEYAFVTGDIEGLHAYLLCGWSDERNAARILNSASRRWGLNGRKWVRYNDLALLLQANGKIAMGVGKQMGADARAQRSLLLNTLRNSGNRAKYEQFASL